MYVTFYGAAREVTGSMHMIHTESDRILLDCGLIQGKRKEAFTKNKQLHFDPGIITNVVLSHAHIDHSGRLPLLTRNNFNGHIISTRATQDICQYLLPDSGHIQESDADYLNYKSARSGLSQRGENGIADQLSGREEQQVKKLLKSSGNRINREALLKLADKYSLAKVEPLYTEEDARFSLGFFNGIPYKTPMEIGKNMTCTFYEAGHILGSAIAIIHYKTPERTYTVGFTGDLGRFDRPILKNPTLEFREEDRNLDLLIMESTYGNRFHEGTQDLDNRVKEEFNATCDRGGTIVIPSFALGRSQEILYVIHSLYEQGAVPALPVYVDSPLASAMTTVFGEHPELYDKETHETFLKQGMNPFHFDQLKFVSSVEESMALMREDKPHVVISASGMCEAGRILHHLRYKIHNPKNTILIVGFMAEHTLGRRILELGEEYENNSRKGNPPLVKILGKEYPLQARVCRLGGFSAHADQNEMTRFLKESNLNIKKIAVVHGEESASLTFADHLKDLGYTAVVPRRGESVRV